MTALFDTLAQLLPDPSLVFEGFGSSLIIFSVAAFVVVIRDRRHDRAARTASPSESCERSGPVAGIRKTAP